MHLLDAFGERFEGIIAAEYSPRAAAESFNHRGFAGRFKQQNKAGIAIHLSKLTSQAETRGRPTLEVCAYQANIRPQTLISFEELGGLDDGPDHREVPIFLEGGFHELGTQEVVFRKQKSDFRFALDSSLHGVTILRNLESGRARLHVFGERRGKSRKASIGVNAERDERELQTSRFSSHSGLRCHVKCESLEYSSFLLMRCIASQTL